MRERGREEFEREGVKGKRIEGGRERGRERAQWVGERKRRWRKGVGRMGRRKEGYSI